MKQSSRERESFLAIIDLYSSRKIAVVGDLIADEFLHGQISRVSREAPVLVLEYRDLVRLPGGAANAANNLLDLGCKVKVVAAVGRDEPGRQLVELLARKGADVLGIATVRDYATPVKTRILAGAHHSAPQQVVRVDRAAHLEAGLPVSRAELRTALRGSDGIIISDYGYGAIDGLTIDCLKEAAGKTNIPLVVDTRFRVSEFQGVTAITPNITELEASKRISIGTDTNLLHGIGQETLRRQKLRYLLVTQGRFGMTLFQRRAAPIHIPIYGSDEVADVTGAGDTVIAVFTASLACGASAEQAARLANYAGGIVVMKRGTATVTHEELRAAVCRDLSG